MEVTKILTPEEIKEIAIKEVASSMAGCSMPYVKDLLTSHEALREETQKLKAGWNKAAEYHVQTHEERLNFKLENERLRALLLEARNTIQRRMSSDETCGFHFDENFGELIAKLEQEEAK